MTPTQIELISTTFEQVQSIADTAAELFYARLFELDPLLVYPLKGESRDVTEQGRRLIALIHSAINRLKSSDIAISKLRAARPHSARPATEERRYETVGAALLWTLEMGLGEDFTPETRAAWVELCTLLADMLNEEEEQWPREAM